MLRKEHGGQESKDASEEVLYKIDIPANRYDMLCLEGIARALNIFNRRIDVPQYKLADMTGEQHMWQIAAGYGSAAAIRTELCKQYVPAICVL